MKYSDIIKFQPIESTIQLNESNSNETGIIENVKTYVMSDVMAEGIKVPVIDQFQMEEVIDNKGVILIGNYGTGKSHLLSVISAVAEDENKLKYLQNKKFAENMKRIAGRFEVLRIELGGITMPFRSVIMDYVKEDYERRGIKFEVPDLDKVKDNKQLIKDMMMAFNDKYPGKGYLIIIDEFLAYLSGRKSTELVVDAEFLRVMGEMCSKSNLRVIFGAQEKIFDNPKFSFVADSFKHVSDRFTQYTISKEATEYVVSERILKKTPEQKEQIRKHLENFSSLYSGMSTKLDEFVDLYPIHPAYIEVFNKIFIYETRHILKDISETIRRIISNDIPVETPGIYSFDNSWTAIKTNGLLKSDVSIGQVVNASVELEEIINHSFQKQTYKPLAIQIIYALSVHRLTTSSIDVPVGLTAENLKDDLCLYLKTPEQDAEFLLGAVNATLREIRTTVSGKYIIYNESNSQYYIDVKQAVDFDEKIRQRSELVSDDEMNRDFYKVVYSCLEWDKKQYVPGFEIYEYDLNWDSHNIFREGYLFMGLPGERSTAQPEKDFYIHFIPPYGTINIDVQNLDDEVYLYFKSSDEFKTVLTYYSAANSMASISEGKDKEAYHQKANQHRKRLIKLLNDNKNTVFDVVYKKERKQLIEVLKNRYKQDTNFGDAVELAASICLDDCFNTKYPKFPVMKTKITRKNMADNAAAAVEYFGGRKTQQATILLQSFGVLDGDKIAPQNSKYASFYGSKIEALSPQGVINYTDIFEPQGNYWQIDKEFKIWHNFMPIIFLSLVYAGKAEITLKNGGKVTAASLEKAVKGSRTDIEEFKYISKTAQMSMAEIRKLFEIVGLNPVMLDNPNDRDSAVEQLDKKALDLCNSVVTTERKLDDAFELWGEQLVSPGMHLEMQKACTSIKEEFSNYSIKYNTFPKLNNFDHSLEDVEELGKQIKLLYLIPEYLTFKNDCTANVTYMTNIDFLEIDSALKASIENVKQDFRETRDSIAEGTKGEMAAAKINTLLDKIKEQYIEYYFGEHKKKRLNHEDANRKGKIQSSVAMDNLKKLRVLDVLSSAKLSAIEQELASIKVCYDLTINELRIHHECPHCQYRIGDISKNIYGQLDTIENKIDELTTEWTNLLLSTVTDPTAVEKKEFLSPDQKKVIEEFSANKQLPNRVDDFFVKSIQAFISNYEIVVIDVDNLAQKLDELAPSDIMAFKTKVNSIIDEYIKDKNVNSVRIVVKKKENEE